MEDPSVTDDGLRLWLPRLRLARVLMLGLVCAAAALPLAGFSDGWSYVAAPLTAGALTGVIQARQHGPMVVCAFAVVSFVLTGVAMVLFLLLFLLLVGPLE
jgi:hypothetical protein